MPERVVYQVRDGPLRQPGVGGDEREPVLGPDAERDAARLGSALALGHDVGHELRERRRLKRGADLGGVEPGEVEQVGHHVREPLGGPERPLRVGPPLLRPGPVAHDVGGLEVAAEGGERAPEVVAHVRDELAALGVGAAEGLDLGLDPSRHPVERGAEPAHLAPACGVGADGEPAALEGADGLGQPPERAREQKNGGDADEGGGEEREGEPAERRPRQRPAARRIRDVVVALALEDEVEGSTRARP